MKALSLPLLVIVFFMSQPCDGQVIDLQPLLLEAKGLEPYEMEDMQAEHISEEGHIAGTYLSTTDLQQREVFVLRYEEGSYQPYFLGSYAQAQIADFSAQDLWLNYKREGERAVLRFRWQAAGGGKYEAGKPRLPVASAAVAAVSGQQVALNAQLQNLPADQPLPANAYAADVPADFARPVACERGMLADLEAGTQQPVAFPMALALNLDSRIYDITSDGRACGASKGFAGKDYLASMYPFYADADSVYLILIGLRGQAMVMNEAGLVAGLYQPRGSQQGFGFVWNFADRFNDQDGWQVLRNNRPATPRAINEAGIVVGNDENQAFVWQKGVFQYLNSLVSTQSEDYAGWSFRSLHDVNDQGIAVGQAAYEGGFKAVAIDLKQLGY